LSAFALISSFTGAEPARAVPRLRQLEEVAMKHQALTELQECDRKVIDVFARHDRDGRAITVESLAAGADISVSSPETHGGPAGSGCARNYPTSGRRPIPGTPVAFRLSQDMLRRCSDTARDGTRMGWRVCRPENSTSTPSGRTRQRPLTPARGPRHLLKGYEALL
jgi:hypothetical protein